MKRNEFLLALGFFLLATCIFFYKTILFGTVPFPGDLLISQYNPWKSYSYLGYNPGSYPQKAQYFDTIRQIYPWRTFSLSVVKSGKLPFWNPYNFSGSPLLANNQSAVFYPLNVVYLLFSQVIGWTLLVMLQPFLAALFTYFYCRSIGVRAWGSMLSGIAYGFSLFSSVFLEYNTIGHVIAFLPLLLFSVEKLSRSFSIRYSLIFAAGIIFAGTAGHLQIFGFLVLFLFIYALARIIQIRPPREFLVKSGTIFLMLLFAVGMLGIQLIPTFELIYNSARVPQSYQFLLQTLLLQPYQLILFLSPDIFGNPAVGNYLISDTYPGNAVYIGLLPILLAFWVVTVKRKNPLVALFSIASLTLLLLFVRTPLTEQLYKVQIPLLSTGSPTNAIFLLSFCLSVLAGLGFDEWVARKSSKQILFLFVFGLLFSLIFVAARFSHIPVVSTKNLLYSMGVFAFSAFFLLLPKKAWVTAGLILFLTVFDLFYFFQKFNPFVPKALVFPQANVTTWLRDKGIDRFWGYGSAAIEANFATEYGIFSPDGYDPLYPKIYGQLLQSSKDGRLGTDFNNNTRSDAIIAPGFGENDFSENPYRLRILDILGVKFVLDREGNASTQKTFPPERFRLVYAKDGWKIFENRKAAPRAFVTSDYRIAKTSSDAQSILFSKDFNPATTVILPEKPKDIVISSVAPGSVNDIFYNSNDVSIKVAMQKPGILFLSDVFYPGWKAFVDGKETPISTADYAFRAVVLPKGNHSVVFSYLPDSFFFGQKVSIMSLFGFLIFLLIGWYGFIKKR